MRSRTPQSSRAVRRAAAIGIVSIGAVATCVLAGCSPRSSSNDSPPPTKSAEATADAAAADGKMVPTYEDATTPEARLGRQILQNHRSLEDFASETNDLLTLPFDVPLRGSQCGEPNAFWDPGTKSLTICYEDAAANFQIFSQAGDPDPTASTLGVEEATYAHELGHMVIDLYDLPATGREEDDADQMSAYLLLQPDDKGNIDPTNVTSIIDSAREFDAISQAPGDFDESAFYDVHSLNQTRKYNLLCWAYGADPAGQADLVDSGRLPQARADSCENEWNRLDRAWSTLLDPHLKR